MRRILTLLPILILLATGLRGQGLYDVDNITTVEIFFEEANWDAILDAYKADGNGERLLADVRINSVEFDSVGVRYRGSTSYDPANGKNPFNIKLNHIKNHNFQSFRTLKLSNGQQDPSFLREVLSYEIARDYMVAPKCNYTKVFVNGSYHGMYVSTENINGDFGDRYLFADDDNPRIEGDANNPSNLLFLGTDSIPYYNNYALDSDWGWAPFVDMINILNNNPGQIETVVNIDRVIWMLAFNTVLVNLDSYTGHASNYYTILDDNGTHDFILWDLNESFGAFDGVQGVSGTLPIPLADLQTLDPFLRANDSSYPLLQLILNNPTYKRMFVAHARTILEQHFANGEFVTRAQQLQDLIAPDVQSDPNAFYGYNTFLSNLNSSFGGFGNLEGAVGITELMQGRVTYLQSHPDFTAAPPAISSLAYSPDPVPEFGTANITIAAPGATNVIIGYREEIFEEFIKVQMYDNGTNGDATAGDGIFSLDLPVTDKDIQFFIYAENDDAGIFTPEKAAREFHTIDVATVVNDVVINEFMANNASIQADQDGEFDDWIELYNNSSSAISLDGYHLTDNANWLYKWEFPEGTTIGPNAYIVVWADENGSQAGLHANFKLSVNGEELLLVAPDSVTVLDEIYFGAQTANVSYGRFPNGTGDFTFLEPTFLAQNNQTISVDDLLKNIDMKIFPNPTSGFFEFTAEVPETQSGNLLIHAMDGRLIHQEVLNAPGGNFRTSVDASGMPGGIYLVTLQTDVGSKTGKLVVR